MSESNIQYNKRNLKRAVFHAHYRQYIDSVGFSQAIDDAIDCAYEMAAMNMALTITDGAISVLSSKELDALVAKVAMRRLPQPPPETAPRHREATDGPA